jgi:hypothetical protein
MFVVAAQYSSRVKRGVAAVLTEMTTISRAEPGCALSRQPVG